MERHELLHWLVDEETLQTVEFGPPAPFAVTLRYEEVEAVQHLDRTRIESLMRQLRNWVEGELCTVSINSGMINVTKAANHHRR